MPKFALTMMRSTITSAFLRRLILWSVLSIALSTLFVTCYDVVVRSSWKLSLRAVVAATICFVSLSGLALIGYSANYSNAGGNSFNRFRIRSLSERIVLSVLSAVLVVSLQAAGHSWTSLLLPTAAVAYVAMQSLFFSCSPTIQIVPTPLPSVLQQIARSSALFAVHSLTKAFLIIFACRVTVDVFYYILRAFSRASALGNVVEWYSLAMAVLSTEALVLTFHLLLTSSACLHFISRLLVHSCTYPIDFAKLSQSTTPEAVLLGALADQRSAVPFLAPGGKLDKRDYRDWFRAYNSLCERLSGPTGAGRGRGVPVLDSLTGSTAEDFFNLLMQAHAECDLNRLVRMQARRRASLFDEERWAQLLSAELSFLAAATTQVQLVLSFLRDPVSEVADGGTADIKEAAEVIKPVLIMPNIYATAPAAGAKATTRKTALQKVLQSAVGRKAVILMKAWLPRMEGLAVNALHGLLGLPTKGELAIEEQEDGQPTVLRNHKVPSVHTQELLKQVFAPMFAQRLMLSIENMSLLLQSALAEDQMGVTVPTVPVVMLAMLKLESALAMYNQVLHQCYEARVTSMGKVQYIRYMVRSAHYLPAEVVAVQQALKEGMLRTVEGYHDILQEHMFPAELRGAYQQHKGQLLG